MAFLRGRRDRSVVDSPPVIANLLQFENAVDLSICEANRVRGRGGELI